jgi:tetratricopeptide (TPR) repeat protein
MRRILLLLNLLLFLFIVKSSYANLQAINIGAIKEWKTFEEEIDYLWDNQGMYRHYQPTWSFPVTRESVIEKLETLLKKIDKLESKNKSNIDYYLLKGDIAHYLYNLDATKYYKPALAYYEKTKKIDKNDYRAYWFIGQHQCLSGHDIQGIDSYREIIDIAEPSSLHWAFWGDYSNCAAIGFMPFNQQMAFMHMFKNIG